MLTKYSIEYSAASRKHPPVRHEYYYTDDPLSCQQFIEDALERGLTLHAIRHDGAMLSAKDFDQMVKVAAGAIASKRICASLGIKIDEERHRFGFAA